MRNSKALLAFLFALAAVAILVLAGARANDETGIDSVVIAALPAAFVVVLAGLSLARRGRFDFQRTLGRRGGRSIAALARGVNILALLLAFTGSLAIAVFAVLKLVA